MRLTTIQADSYPPGSLVRWFGGFRTDAARINVYPRIPNTLVIEVPFHRSPIVQSIFTTAC